MDNEKFSNCIIHGNCIDIMKQLPAHSVDFILTDPPYLVNYKDRDGRSILNDVTDSWLCPSFRQMYRVLKPDSFCVTFYGWSKVDRFMYAWRQAGFRAVGHITFAKAYASNAGFVKYHHESAYLLVKGQPKEPTRPIPDVLPFEYSGNRLHPTQKPVNALKNLIQAFSPQNGVVLDPFCGSASTCLAAKSLFRNYIGIELDPRYHAIAQRRLEAVF